MRFFLQIISFDHFKMSNKEVKFCNKNNILRHQIGMRILIYNILEFRNCQKFIYDYAPKRGLKITLDLQIRELYLLRCLRYFT